MRLLVTGRKGQVAQALLGLASAGLEVVALGRPVLDITDRASIDRAIAEHRPDVVVSAAAYTAVDKAESDEAAAFAANRDGAGHVAAAAAAAGLPVIHVSTDYVFSGEKPQAYLEDDATGPQGVYGRSKLAGEAAVAAANPRHAILRTAWVFGPYGNNFLKTMLRLAETRDVLKVVGDQQGTPTYAPDIAAGIVAVAERMVAGPDEAASHGVFHMVAGGETTWAGFAAEIFAHSALDGGPSALVEPITTAEYPTPARRPANSRLDTARFRRAFGHELPTWQSGVERCLAALRANAAA
ncbi:dTDP-4-dehydrorhamnose reductase [Aureimonas sp. AU12]|uniref:dTDP-4-dehydrorhamnose reductase n=1 Tax=Aureimonas sp. AU12 TaxID=1638161 RepID=UPI0007849AB0|nr:dTDP-4-dehydrorhamnose reductase [Aureimonas sp. AU12]